MAPLGRPYGSRSQRETEYRHPLPGFRTEKVRILAYVQLEQHEKAHRAARAMGVSASLLMALLIERMEVDDNGCPAWGVELVGDKARAAPLPGMEEGSAA